MTHENHAMNGSYSNTGFGVFKRQYSSVESEKLISANNIHIRYFFIKWIEKYLIKYMYLIDVHNSIQAIIEFHTLNMSQIVSAKF